MDIVSENITTKTMEYINKLVNISQLQENSTFISNISNSTYTVLTANNDTVIYENNSYPIHVQNASATDHLYFTSAATTAFDSNTTIPCQNEYCVSDEEYVDMVMDFIFPSPLEWFLIIAYIFVFVVGLVGNFLVCFAVWRNHTMRTVTNYFIVNLAVADFLVILICLPPTLVSDITETWFMGSVMCKIVKYFQAVSVSVSVLTLSAISIERWYAICHPLKFKATPSRAKYMIVITWLISLGITLPELVVLDTMSPPKFIGLTILLTSCKPTWSNTNQAAYQYFLIVTMYLMPFLLMFVTYFQIAKTLWSNSIPTETSRDQLNPSSENRGSTEALLHTRRKAAKMLIAVVVMFGICYLPVHLLNILRYAGVLVSTGQLSIYFALIAHWLCYFNSAINPVIYSFMSARFRKEFLTACICHSIKRPANGDNYNRRQNLYIYRYHNAAGLQNGRILNSRSTSPRWNQQSTS